MLMPRSLPARWAMVLFLSWRTLGEGQESSGRRWAVQFGHVEFEPLKMCEALSSLAPITLCNLVLAPHLSSPRSLVTLSFLLLHKHTMSAFAYSDASAENVFLSSLSLQSSWSLFGSNTLSSQKAFRFSQEVPPPLGTQHSNRSLSSPEHILP